MTSFSVMKMVEMHWFLPDRSRSVSQGRGGSIHLKQAKEETKKKEFFYCVSVNICHIEGDIFPMRITFLKS